MKSLVLIRDQLNGALSVRVAIEPSARQDSY